MVSKEVEVVGRTAMGERSQTNGVLLVHGTAGLLAVSSCWFFAHSKGKLSSSKFKLLAAPVESCAPFLLQRISLSTTEILSTSFCRFSSSFLHERQQNGHLITELVIEVEGRKSNK